MTENPCDYTNIQSHKVHNKNILITGSTQGIGEQAAISLAKQGANVYIHGRNENKGREIVNKFQKEFGTKSKFFQCDLSSLPEVRATSELIKEELDHLDILIHNAGGYFRGKKFGSNNIEYTFTVNYLSGFLLTMKLMPLLNKKDLSQIILSSSSAHKSIDKLDLNTVETRENKWESYARSKLANIMFSISLARELDDKNILTSTVHPGLIIDSGLLKHIPGPFDTIGSYTTKIPLPGIATKAEGAATLINAIYKNRPEYSSIYYNEFVPERPSNLAQNTTKQDELWEYSINSTNVTLPRNIR